MHTWFEQLLQLTGLAPGTLSRLLESVGIVLAILLAVVVVWRTSVDRFVARGIEYYGSEVLGTTVTVDSAEIVISEGRGSIRGLRIAQPRDGRGLRRWGHRSNRAARGPSPP